MKSSDSVQEDKPLFPSTPLPPPEDAIQFRKLLAQEKVEQRTPEWYALRKSMITASDWHMAIGSSKSKVETSKTDLILKKCDQGVPFTGNKFTRWGQKYEPVATRIYELRQGVRVHEFGVLRHPQYSFLGASPDGITALGIMLEIKCPYARKITGIIPDYYYIQVQGQLEVCNLNYCDFLECEIEEYCGLDDYLKDNYEKTPVKYDTKYLTSEEKEKYQKNHIFQFNANGLEKGAIITFMDPDGNEYYSYSEVGLSSREFDRWYHQEVKRMKKDHPDRTEKDKSFWCIRKLSCIRVERDREWFKKVLPVLTQTWKEIEHYRNVGCDSLLKKKESKKRSDKPKDLDSAPDEKEYNKLLYGKDKHNGLEDIASSFLTGELDRISDDNVTVKTEEIKKDPELEDMMKEMSLYAYDLPDIRLLEKPELTLDQLEAISDLELAKSIFPQYIPIDPKVFNERSVKDLKIKLAGFCKIITRCKNALSRLIKVNKQLLEDCSDTIQNTVHEIHVWMNGIPDLINDFLRDSKIKLSSDIVEALKESESNAKKWCDTLMMKWNEIWTRQEIKVKEVKKEPVKEIEPVKEKEIEPVKKKLTLEDIMKKSIQELVPDKYNAIMAKDIPEDKKKEELKFLESMKSTYAILELYKYN